MKTKLETLLEAALTELRDSTSGTQPQLYATASQLARMLGVHQQNMHHQLKKLREEGRVEVLELNINKEGGGYARYKISDVIEALRVKTRKEKKA